jgi:hypothetical protein
MYLGMAVGQFCVFFGRRAREHLFYLIFVSSKFCSTARLFYILCYCSTALLFHQTFVTQRCSTFVSSKFCSTARSFYIGTVLPTYCSTALLFRQNFILQAFGLAQFCIFEGWNSTICRFVLLRHSM